MEAFLVEQGGEGEEEDEEEDEDEEEEALVHEVLLFKSVVVSDYSPIITSLRCVS